MLGTLIVAIALLAIIGGMMHAGDVASSGPAAVSAPTADAAAPAAQSDATDAPDATEAPANPIVTGGVATIGGLRYTIESVRLSSTYTSSYDTATASGEFIIVHVDVANVGSKPADVNENDFHLVRDGSTYDPDTKATGLSDTFALDTVNPGTHKAGNEVFDVPANTALSKYHLQVFGNDSSDSVEMALR